MKEEFVRKIGEKLIDNMGDDFTKEQVNKIMALTRIVLSDYEIKKTVTDLVVYEGDINEQLIKKFLAVKLVSGCSERTIAYYKTILQQVAQKTQKRLSDLTTDDILLYFAIRKTQDKVSECTQDNELRILRTFFSWATIEEIVDKNPCLRISKIKSKKKVKEAFTETELELMRSATKQSRFGQAKKHLAILEVLISTGCRATECAGIKIADIDGDRIKILGKGNKERYVYLTARAQIAIKEYLNERKSKSPYLFTGYSISKKQETEKLGRESINSIVKKIAKRAGIEHAHAHKFRRTAATLAMRRGMPIELVSKMLGHEQLTTTQIYLQITEAELAAAHEKYIG